MFYVYGDYGYTNEEELLATTDLAAATDKAERLAEQHDFGGFDQIEVVWFTDDGEIQTQARFFPEPAYDLYSD
jgi:hypothetical protein